MKSLWLVFWIKVAYALRLRKPFNSLQRWLKKEHKAPRAPLPRFDNPGEMRRYLRGRFDYRLDEAKLFNWKLPMDWVSEPEVFQARLESEEVLDGDCDDYHFWGATVLGMVPGVSDVHMLHVGYTGGGHAVCVYMYEERWFLLNYDIQQIKDPNDAPAIVAKWGTEGKDTKPVWFVFESIARPFVAAAIGPGQTLKL